MKEKISDVLNGGAPPTKKQLIDSELQKDTVKTVGKSKSMQALNKCVRFSGVAVNSEKKENIPNQATNHCINAVVSVNFTKCPPTPAASETGNCAKAQVVLLVYMYTTNQTWVYSTASDKKHCQDN